VSQPRTTLLRLESFAGGLNDTDPPHKLGDTQLAVAAEVELTSSGGIRRRSGIARASAQPATLDFRLLHRHTPSQALSATEIWALPISMSNAYRSTTGTTWTTVSASDTGTSTPPTDAASFNGKLYVAYEKTGDLDRLHCWDGTSLRRAGISTPSAPSVGNTGAGSYAATVRYYKVQFYYADASNRYTFSDLSATTTFTPSGAGTAARVTKPTTTDSATRWRVWGSPDNVSFYLLTDQAVGTTTWDDTTVPASYNTIQPANLAAESGAYTPPWSAKYLLVDENRLLIAGAFENVRYASRVGWSSIIGTAAAAYGESVTVADDERFPPDHYLDLDSDEGGEITGMEMLNGSVYVFKRYAIYKLVRTGNAEVPYKPVVVTKVVGALSRKSIVPGEDESGNPCLYFLSERGPYRFGGAGLQYLGGDIETLWALVSKRGWLAPPHGVYDARRGQVRWWVPRTDFGNIGNAPDCQLVFHVRLGRPSQAGRVTGGWTTSLTSSKPNYAACSAMLPDSLTNRDSELAPYGLHYNTSFSYPPVLWKYTTSQASDDTVHTTTGAITGTESFTPTVTTKTFNLGLGDKGGVRDVYVACQPSAGGVTLSATLTRDFGAETRTATQAYTGTTTRLPQQIADLTMAQAQYISLTLSSATQTGWTLDDVALRVSREEPV
jgi:hypothetical protein